MNPSNDEISIEDYKNLISTTFYPISHTELDLENTKLLVNGKYGNLFLSKWNTTPCLINILEADKWKADTFYSEAKIHQLVGSHPNCISLYGVINLTNVGERWEFGTPPPHALILEDPVRGNVRDFLQPESTLDMNTGRQQSLFQMAPGQSDHHLIVKIALGVVRGVRHIETFDEGEINLFRLISADHIYLKNDLTPVIQQYGTYPNPEKAYEATMGYNTEKYFRYIPPESIEQATSLNYMPQYLKASDIWHIGIFLIEICTGNFQKLWGDLPIMGIIDRLIKRKPIQIPAECHPTMRRIIQLCLNYDINQRIRMASLDKIQKMLEQHYQEVKPPRTVPSSLYYDYPREEMNQLNVSRVNQLNLTQRRPLTVVRSSRLPTIMGSTSTRLRPSQRK